MNRRQPLVSGQIYHVFNRGIDRRPTFTNKREFQRSLKALDFYRFNSTSVSLSRFLSLDAEGKAAIEAQQLHLQPRVEVLAYCLMPNHFHLLVRQLAEGGISTYLSQVQNSYTRYFNTKHARNGALFLNRFKSVRIETEPQLRHVSRYIHLNPYTSYVVKTVEELLHYPWSSLPDYLQHNPNTFSRPEIVLEGFHQPNSYQDFVLNQADYQRSLATHHHLLLDNDEDIATPS